MNQPTDIDKSTRDEYALLIDGFRKRGDVFADGTRSVDDANPSSLSFAFVIPVASF